MIACLGHLKSASILNLFCKAPKPMPLGSLFSKLPFEWCYKWINKYTYSSNFEVTFRLKILLWLHSLHFNHLSSFYFPTKVFLKFAELFMQYLSRTWKFSYYHQIVWFSVCSSFYVGQCLCTLKEKSKSRQPKIFKYLNFCDCLFLSRCYSNLTTSVVCLWVGVSVCHMWP